MLTIFGPLAKKIVRLQHRGILAEPLGLSRGQDRYLKYEFDVVSHGYPISVGQSEDLVVVQHSVEILDPDRVHWSIANDPLSTFE